VVQLVVFSSLGWKCIYGCVFQVRKPSSTIGLARLSFIRKSSIPELGTYFFPRRFVLQSKILCTLGGQNQDAAIIK
jgi:hypothetical protein